MEPLRPGTHQNFGGFQSKVEHPYQIMKRVFGFTRIRYRGLVKNTHRVQVTCALVNLFLVRKRLLKPALATK